MGKMRKDRFLYIKSRLGEKELLGQLIEESAELIQASRKLCRFLEGVSLPNSSVIECQENFVEEIADVLLTMELLDIDMEKANEWMESKAKRWEVRLRTEEESQKDKHSCNRSNAVPLE
jgi:NTP pyrophosphatase (non-canonical NTP hydrolase)